jgi:sugar/nucleoside kinase (ribokinase family)
MSLNVPAKHIAGTAGAGDAFCAGMLLGLHEEWNLGDALQLGVCAGAASLLDSTCTASMLPLKKALDLSKKFRPRKPLE